MNNRNIDEFIILNDKFSFIYTFTFSLIIIFIIFLYISFSFNYETFNEYIGTYNSGKVSLYIKLDDIKNIINDKKIIVDDNVYSYKIDCIDDELYVENGENYKKVSLIFNLPKKYRINNCLIKMKKKKEKKKIILYLKDFVKGEVK